MHILVNAANVTAMGTRSLVRNLLPPFIHSSSKHTVTLILPDEEEFHSLPKRQNVNVIYWRIIVGLWNNATRLKYLLWDLPRLSRRIRPDICLTLGDLGPFSLPCIHIVFLHNYYFVSSKIEAKFLAWSHIKRAYMTWHFSKSLQKVSTVIVQTPVMAERLLSMYTVDSKQIVQITQPVPEHVTHCQTDDSLGLFIGKCSKPIRLLFLSAYYPHKNHAILLSVCDMLRQRSLATQVQIFTTLEETSRTRGILKIIKQNPDVITNLGPLPPAQVANAFRASTALFLPTLAESYGLTYLEAMACGVPILTSDRDFARWMCQDLAFYFDPFDPVSIVNAIEFCPRNDLSDYQFRAHKRLQDFPRDWNEVARAFWDVLSRQIRVA